MKEREIIFFQGQKGWTALVSNFFFFYEKSIEHTELVHNQNTAQQIEFYPINTMCLLKILEAVIFFFFGLLLTKCNYSHATGFHFST